MTRDEPPSISAQPDAEYFWDGTGEDPAVAELEDVLSPLRFDRPAPEIEVESSSESFDWAALRPFAIAAALVLVVGAAITWRWQSGRTLPQAEAPSATAEPVGTAEALATSRTFWQVRAARGAPTVGSEVLRGEGELHAGQWLETDAVSSAVLAVADIGALEVAPDTRLSLVRSRKGTHRVRMDRGKIRATITVLESGFVVETPSALVVDLGCVYTLSVDAKGGVELEVSDGLVALERGGQRSYVPHGAWCGATKGGGPGVPLYTDAPAELATSVTRIVSGDREAIGSALRSARSRDALTLWHLLRGASKKERADIHKRMVALGTRIPETVDPKAVIDGDARAIEAWREALELVWRKAKPVAAPAWQDPSARRDPYPNPEGFLCEPDDESCSPTPPDATDAGTWR